MNSNAAAGSAARIGDQRPRIESVPESPWSSAEDAIDIMALAGRQLDDWQCHVLEGALGEREDGRWAAFEVGLIVPRQNGKNVCIEARELAGLFLFGDRVIIHSAHQFKTARKSFRDMERLIRGTPELYQQVLGFKGQGPRDEIKGIRQNGAELSIELANGNRLEYHARTAGGGKGFTGDLIVLDEAYDLDADEIAAMMPTMAARSLDGNPQIWYTSSAGMPSSEQLAELRERGSSEESGRLAYFEWSATDDSDSDDTDAWYRANPGMGIRISAEYVRETEFESMGDEQFRRERMGIWARLGGEAVVTESEWARCHQPDAKPGRFVSFAIDIPPARDSANIAAVSGVGDEVYAAIIDRRVGTSWVPQALRQLQDAWGASATPVVLGAASAAGSLLPELKRERVRTLLISDRDYGRACADLYDAILNRRMVHRGQQELDEAMSAARTKPMGETLWKWDRKNLVSDISPLVAVTMAWHGWTIRGQRKERAAQHRESGAPAGRASGGRTSGGRRNRGRTRVTQRG